MCVCELYCVPVVSKSDLQFSGISYQFVCLLSPIVKLQDFRRAYVTNEKTRN